MRKTHATVQVALAILADPAAKIWGYELSKMSGVRSGVMYPILSRMLAEGWLTDGWEDRHQMTEQRPPRRYYEVTERGLRELGGMVEEARQDRRFAGLRWSPT